MITVIFDLDGTLIDSVPEIHRVANEVFALEKLEAITLDQTRSYVGHGISAFIAQAFADKGLPTGDARHEAMADEMVRRYSNSHALTNLYPGAREALETLHDAGHSLGICTNKPLAPAKSVLAHFGLSDCFQTVIGGDSFDERKPHPKPLLQSMKNLGHKKALFVGDSEVDAETAMNAQTPFALFTQGYRKTSVENIPHTYSFDDFVDLPKIAKAL